jgi:chromate reductase
MKHPLDREIVRVLGFSGSLRAGSFNRSLLKAAQALAPDAVTIEIFDLAEIPLDNHDVEQRGDPAPVAAFKEAIAAAHALLIVTPEYQRGIPGVLKNALDWASRPARNSPMRGAIMGASPSATGTARAQEQLRQVLAFNEISTVREPEVLVSRVHEKVDAAGTFVDESVKPFIRMLLENLAALTIGLRDDDEPAQTGPRA